MFIGNSDEGNEFGAIELVDDIFVRKRLETEVIMAIYKLNNNLGD